MGRDTSGPTTDDAMTRSEEQLRVGTETREAGRARLRKHVVTEHQQVTVPVTREEVTLEREPITEANRGDAYDGPAISEEEHEVTLHAERPVVDTEAVAVERVRLGKETVTDQETVGGEVRKEEIELDRGDATVRDDVRGDAQPPFLTIRRRGGEQRTAHRPPSRSEPSARLRSRATAVSSSRGLAAVMASAPLGRSRRSVAGSPAQAGTHSAVHGPGRCGGVAPGARSMTPASRSVIVGWVASVGWVMASPLTAMRSSERRCGVAPEECRAPLPDTCRRGPFRASATTAAAGRMSACGAQP